MDIITIGQSNIDAFTDILGGELRPSQTALGILDAKGTPVGAGIFSIDRNVLIWDGIFIAPSYRRKRIGTRFFKRVRSIMLDKGIRDHLVFYEENDGLTAFFQSLGFICTESDRILSFKASDLIYSDHFDSYCSSSDQKNAVPLSSLGSKEMETVYKYVKKSEMHESLLEPGAYDPDISFAIPYNKGGLLLIKKYEDDFQITALLSFGKSPHTIAQLMSALRDTLNKEGRLSSHVFFAEQNPKLTDNLTQVIGEKALISSGNGWSGYLRI